MKKQTFAGIRKGQKFRVIANNGGHDYPLGVNLTFSKNGTDTISMNNIMVSKDGRSHNNINFNEIELIFETVAEMKIEIEKLKVTHAEQVAVLAERIAICEKLGMDVYDEDFVRVYNALEALNSDATILEKTKLITELIQG